MKSYQSPVYFLGQLEDFSYWFVIKKECVPIQPDGSLIDPPAPTLYLGDTDLIGLDFSGIRPRVHHGKSPCPAGIEILY